MAKQDKDTGDRRAQPMHFPHQGEDEYADNGATKNNFEVRTAAFVWGLLLCSSHQDNQCDDDSEQEDQTGHCVGGSITGFDTMISVLAARVSGADFPRARSSGMGIELLQQQFIPRCRRLAQRF